MVTYPKTSNFPFRYVVVEGTIGVGKSGLTERLVQYYQAYFVKERPEDNPFLLRFYRNTRQLALATQLAFLKQRIDIAHHMMTEKEFFSSQKMVIADFLFDKDIIFAKMILDDDEFNLYTYFANKIVLNYPIPDLVIYLQASEPIVRKRIAARGDDYEKHFPEGYLTRIHTAYSEFFHHYEAAPQLIVNTDNFDFVGNDEDFALLLKHIENAQGPRSYFNKDAQNT